MLDEMRRRVLAQRRQHRRPITPEFLFGAGPGGPGAAFRPQTFWVNRDGTVTPPTQDLDLLQAAEALGEGGFVTIYGDGRTEGRGARFFGAAKPVKHRPWARPR
jgi:hypothetical protein